MNDLVVQRLDKANAALHEAKTIQETKNIHDVAHAAEIYAKRQKLGEEAVNYAYSIKIEALRKLGEILKEEPKRGPEHFTGGGSKGSKREPLPDSPPTLEELGISKKESSIAQKLASLPKKEFEEVKAGHESIAQAIKEVEGAKTVKRKAGPPCDGMQFARMAVMDLEQIKDNDTERTEAFEFVKGWINDHA